MGAEWPDATGLGFGCGSYIRHIRHLSAGSLLEQVAGTFFVTCFNEDFPGNKIVQVS
jgi:hypothetical protein